MLPPLPDNATSTSPWKGLSDSRLTFTGREIGIPPVITPPSYTVTVKLPDQAVVDKLNLAVCDRLTAEKRLSPVASDRLPWLRKRLPYTRATLSSV